MGDSIISNSASGQARPWGGSCACLVGYSMCQCQGSGCNTLSCDGGFGGTCTQSRGKWTDLKALCDGWYDGNWESKKISVRGIFQRHL